MRATVTMTVTICLLLSAGCATKRFGRATDVTEAERSAYDCADIDLERAKTRGFLDQVHRDAKFSGADVLAFLGDFGIGNAMERSAAVQSGTDRIDQLNDLAAAKGCP